MSVSKIKSIHSIIFHAIYGAVCIQLTNLSYDDYEHICTLSYYHHQNENMTHLPLFRVRLWNNGMRWRSFYILMMMLVPKHEYEFSVVYHTELNIWGCNYYTTAHPIIFAQGIFAVSWLWMYMIYQPTSFRVAPCYVANAPGPLMTPIKKQGSFRVWNAFSHSQSPYPEWYGTICMFLDDELCIFKWSNALIKNISVHI